MKRLVFKILVITLITVLQFTMMLLCGVAIGYNKGYDDGREAGRHEGKIIQIIEDCKKMLDKQIKDKETEKKEKQEATEN